MFLSLLLSLSALTCQVISKVPQAVLTICKPKRAACAGAGAAMAGAGVAMAGVAVATAGVAVAMGVAVAVVGITVALAGVWVAMELSSERSRPGCDNDKGGHLRVMALSGHPRKDMGVGLAQGFSNSSWIRAAS